MRALLCLAVWALPVTASAADRTPQEKTEAARRITALIDRHLDADWAARKITPASPAADAEFLRRVYLDIVGHTPRVSEVRAFLADTAPDKRAQLVERLLTTPAHAIHFAAVARNEWVPNTSTDFQKQFQGNQFEEWLRTQYSANTPADQLVKKVLTANVNVGQRGRIAFDRNNDQDRDSFTVGAFYQANDVKPENLGAAASRLFLGVKLECAQCHDHPFAPYTRDQFWEFAAFFGEFTPLSPVSPSFVGPLPAQYENNRLTIPNTTKTVVATFFDGETPRWSARSPREELAAWLTDAKNPFFAKNLANRMWGHFFGIGIVDPVDEPGENNPPSHPDLLDELGEAFAEAGFDNRVLIRAITASKAYNLTSKQSHESQGDLRRFARMTVRGLTANQIYDSFLAATGHKDPTPRNERFFDPRDTAGRNAFRNLFGVAATKPTEAQTSILQALLMMNGKPIADQTSVGQSEVLAAIIDAPFLDTEERVEAVFLAALTRTPTPAEKEKYASYVERGGPTGNKQKALADVFWVLLNSTEFLFNH